MKEWEIGFTVRYADGRREDGERRVRAYNIGLALREAMTGWKSRLEAREDVSWVEVWSVRLAGKQVDMGGPVHCTDNNGNVRAALAID